MIYKSKSGEKHSQKCFKVFVQFLFTLGLIKELLLMFYLQDKIFY